MTDLPRLLEIEEMILRLIMSEGPDYGLALVKASGGELKPGSAYVTFGRMIAKGFLTAEPDPAAPPHRGKPRPIYRVTDLGARVLEAYDAARAVFNRPRAR